MINLVECVQESSISTEKIFECVVVTAKNSKIKLWICAIYEMYWSLLKRSMRYELIELLFDLLGALFN